MSEITLEKNHALLEKLANYVMTEVPTKREMNGRFEKVESRLSNVESDIKLILEGMDSQVQEMEIFRTEQIAMKSALARLEKP